MGAHTKPNVGRTRRRASVVLAAAALTFVAGPSAWADTVSLDGDTVTHGGSPAVFSPTADNGASNCAVGDSVAGEITIKWNGNANDSSMHFVAGEPLTVKFYPPDGSGITASTDDDPVYMATPWNSSAPDFNIPFTTQISSTTPDGTYQVGVEVDGQNYSVGKFAGSGRPQYGVSVGCGNVSGPSGTPENPTIDTTVYNNATNVSGTTFDLATSVYDSAALSSATNGTPTGSVTFTLFQGQTCGETDETKQLGSDTESLSSGVAQSSASGALHAGDYHYEVTYTSDSTDLWNSVSSPDCENFTVNKADPASFTSAMHFGSSDPVSGPSLVPTDGSGTATATMGATVHDSATLTGVTTTFVPSGTVSFAFYSSSDCSDTPVSAGSALLSSGYADPSTAEGPLSVGAYAFQPSYGGDNDYNSKTGPCEPLTVSSAIGQFFYTLEHDSTQDTTHYTCTSNSLPCAPGTEKSVGTNSIHTYTLHVQVANKTGGGVTEKVQGGLLGYKGATFLPASGTSFNSVSGHIHSMNGVLQDSQCGAAKITVSKNQIVVVWNAAGDGSTSGAGFSLPNGAACELTIDLQGVKFGASGDQPLTGSWSASQSGPGSYSAKSPYTGNLEVKNT